MTDVAIATSLSRIEERTETIVKKIDSFCEWKDQAAKEIYLLKKAELPERVGRLENWRWYIVGALALIIALVGLGRIIEFLYVVPKQ
ncbi:MAG: hypothetical protein O8C67_15385 [Candidatus Methanoperedens sp.]|nr:hypothetical protein [Candidatus Methanoperedens sp.]